VRDPSGLEPKSQLVWTSFNNDDCWTFLARPVNQIVKWLTTELDAHCGGLTCTDSANVRKALQLKPPIDPDPGEPVDNDERFFASDFLDGSNPHFSGPFEKCPGSADSAAAGSGLTAQANDLFEVALFHVEWSLRSPRG